MRVIGCGWENYYGRNASRGEISSPLDVHCIRLAVTSPYLLSAPPANGCVAVFAEEMTVSIFGSFFMARAIDSFVA